VSITSPANGASFTAPASITINANASDNVSVSKVDFYNGSTLLGTDTSSPYSFSWTNVAAGSYTVTAKATDNQGASTTSAAVSLTVNNSGGCTYPQYVENNGYVAGSRVKNAGNAYECKPYPYSGWCNGAAWAYAPGTGTYWQDAWTLVGPCAGRLATNALGNSELNTEVRGVSMYPNPGSGESNRLTFNFEKAPGHVNVGLKDMNGAHLYGEEHSNVSTSLDVQLPENLPAGLYLIRVVTKTDAWTLKYMRK
jgi:hypothetical protein